eukprot:TRINITY_DN1309_c2_g2_i1.p2 TRINITY_DN1309_c2_g2~~TRINITY_DN1309_c2_g2_i1.p2  ORF type:complete len:125 (+),score=44.58 TRINITY_DN1309_c2_g2_i1:85-459(+)
MNIDAMEFTRVCALLRGVARCVDKQSVDAELVEVLSDLLARMVDDQPATTATTTTAAATTTTIGTTTTTTTANPEREACVHVLTMLLDFVRRRLDVSGGSLVLDVYHKQLNPHAGHRGGMSDTT